MQEYKEYTKVNFENSKIGITIRKNVADKLDKMIDFESGFPFLLGTICGASRNKLTTEQEIVIEDVNIPLESKVTNEMEVYVVEEVTETDDTLNKRGHIIILMYNY